MTRSERVALIERAVAEVPLTTQADLLRLSRASLYYQPVPPSSEEVAIKHRIDELYTAQLTTKRENQSKIATKYIHPLVIRTYVMSTPHTWSGRLAVTCRSR